MEQFDKTIQAAGSQTFLPCEWLGKDVDSDISRHQAQAQSQLQRLPFSAIYDICNLGSNRENFQKEKKLV
jgi:hypothetical protein